MKRASLYIRMPTMEQAQEGYSNGAQIRMLGILMERVEAIKNGAKEKAPA